MKHLSIAVLVLLTLLFNDVTTARCDELSLNETDDAIRISLRGKPVLEYVKTARPVPEGLAKHYRRSGYIHPVYTPNGQQISGDYPRDHAHQHALFFAWTKTTFDGKEYDFWNQAKQSARIEFREVENISREEKQVSFSVKHAFTVGQGDERIDALNEIWTVTVHHTPNDHFLFDIESVQTCASDKPLILEEYHYGGMAFRANDQWFHEKAGPNNSPNDQLFLTSEGKDRLSGNHTRPDWVAMTGPLDGQKATLAVFCSPQNFRAPQHVRLHPTKPYFCFAPMVAGKFTIKPGEKYISRYRYVVMSEAVDANKIDEHWNEYVQPTD